jgi:23S rRNA pseudouridine1911/1915/1917 synthase
MCDCIFIKITQDFLGKRVDTAIAKLNGKLSRTQIQKYIKAGRVTQKGEPIASPSQKISDTSEITIVIDRARDDSNILPENISIDIIYEDSYISIINKRAGIVCHPAPGNRSGTLVNALLHVFGNNLSNCGSCERPGLVHRLDKDTSGLMIIAKTNEAHVAFAKLFSSSKGSLINRSYTCFVFGKPPQKSGEIRTFIRRNPRNRQEYITSDSIGKNAITLYNVVKTIRQQGGDISVIKCELMTGRTHQIRVHMKHIGCHVIGDQAYGKSKISSSYSDAIRNFGRQALHSTSLKFVHPFTHEELSFVSNLPDDMQKLLNEINENSIDT